LYCKPIHLRYQIGSLYCPECFKLTQRKSKRFESSRGLSIHISHNHAISKDSFVRIRLLSKYYLKNPKEISFIEYCFNRGYLY